MFIRDLFEAIFVTERMSAFLAMKRFPKAFIHFSQGIAHKATVGPNKGQLDQRAPAQAKMGINPQRHHRDPPGIYFYYVKWLLTHEDVSDSQFATEYDQFWICDIKKNKNCINLGTIKQEQVVALAQRNGWYDLLISADTPENLNQVRTQKNNLRKPGGKLYAVMDYIANISKERTWMQMLKGVDAIFDPGHGIIAAGEPAQVIVLNKSLIQVLNHGVNKDETKRLKTGALQAVAKQMNAEFQFIRGVPTIRAVVENCPMIYQLKDDEPYLSYFQNGVWVETYERQGFSTEDVANYARGVVMTMEHAVKYHGAEPTGRVSQWSPERVAHLMALIREGGIRFQHRNTKEGGILTYSTSQSGWGAFDFFIHLTSNPDDSLTVNMNFGLGRHIDAEIKIDQTYPANAGDQSVAEDVKRQIVERLLELQREGKVVRPSIFVRMTRLLINYPFQDKPRDPAEDQQ